MKRESNEDRLIPRAFFARSPDDSSVMFHYYLLVGNTAVLSGLYARLCRALLVYTAVGEKEKRASSMTVWDVLCAFGSGLLQKKN